MYGGMNILLNDNAKRPNSPSRYVLDYTQSFVIWNNARPIFMLGGLNNCILWKDSIKKFSTCLNLPTKNPLNCTQALFPEIIAGKACHAVIEPLLSGNRAHNHLMQGALVVSTLSTKRMFFFFVFWSFFFSITSHMFTNSVENWRSEHLNICRCYWITRLLVRESLTNRVIYSNWSKTRLNFNFVYHICLFNFI